MASSRQQSKLRAAANTCFLIIAATPLLLCITLVSSAAAQGGPVENPLMFSGTLIYNLLFINSPPETSGGVGARFAGRLAFRAARSTYVGVGVGSWSRATRATCSSVGCGAAVESWSEAVIYQVYAQRGLLQRVPIWVRAGVGVGNTSTLEPGAGVIRLDERWRTAVSLGAGADIRLRGHFYSTVSADFTLLPRVDSQAQELRHAVSLGLGFTIR
jgi:hypothetical protein